jgi:hypothetical protein
MKIKCKEERELTFFFLLLYLGWNTPFAFSFFFTFFQCWALHLPQVLCLVSPQSSKLLSSRVLPSFDDEMKRKWGERGRKGGGRGGR